MGKIVKFVVLPVAGIVGKAQRLVVPRHRFPEEA